MFLCRVFIAPGGIGRSFEDDLARALQSLADKYTEFLPAVNAANHWVEFPDVDRSIVASMEGKLKAAHLEHDIVIEERCTDFEIENAKYVPLLLKGELVASEKNGEPLNVYSTITCTMCGLPDENTMPAPYVISETHLKRTQQVYGAHNGIVIAEADIAAAIMERCGACLDSGQTVQD